MKTTHCLLTLLAVCIIPLMGCKKAGDEPGPIPVYYGVKMVHLPKMDTEFTNAAPDIQASAARAKQYLRFSQVPQALTELVKLSKNPGLSDSQKETVNGLLEETQQVIANSKPAPGS